MFFGIISIAIGLAILLNSLGILKGTFWGIFWAAFFIAMGIKLLIKNGTCPMCGNSGYHGKIFKKIHGGCCDHDHEKEDHQE